MGDNMLKKFTVKNYKSFKEPITIDFSNHRDYKFNEHCVSNGLLSKLVIYGKNSSGKSNLGYAIFDIVGLLTDKHTNVQQKDIHSFLNADNNEKEATFEYVFKKGNDDIRYLYKKSAPETLIFEELYVNDKKVFSYDYDLDEIDFPMRNELGAENLNFEYQEKGFSTLRYIANNSKQDEDSVIKFIMNFVLHMLWFRSLQSNGYIGLTTGSESLADSIIENDQLNEFEEFLKDLADIDKQLDYEVDETTHKKTIIEKHTYRSLNFEAVLSSGTKALMLLFFWSKKFKNVSFLFMDEFDAFYHHDLSKNIIKYISKLNVQTIFTTHNPYLASNELLRPDCYFVINDGKISSFPDSTDRELREGHSLDKMLRNGEFDG